MGLFKSITGLASKALGSVSSFRKVLDVKPSLLGLALPPQVSMGLKVANVVGDAFGVDLPSEDELKNYAQGKLDHYMKGVVRPVSRTLDSVEDTLKQVEVINGKLVTVNSKLDGLKGKTAEEVINSIDWLL